EPMRWCWLALLVGAVIWLITPAIIYAAPPPDHCSCQTNMLPAVAFENAEAVFIAHVSDVTRPNDKPVIVDWLERLPGVSMPGYSYWRATLTLTESWKGLTTTNVLMHTYYGSSCGVSFKVGGDYIVYAHDSSVGWRTSACDGTTEI